MGSKNANAKKNNKKKTTTTTTKQNSLNSNQSPVTRHSHAAEESGSGKVITDPRFSSVHTDPRFREPPKHKTKVPIDSRFDRMFTDKSFSSSSAPVDKRGKPKKRISQQSSLRHYYKIEEEVDEGEAKPDGEEEVDERSDEEGQELVKTNRVKAGDDTGGSESESIKSEDEDETSELESSTDTDEDADEEVYEEEAPDMQEEIPEIEKETHRLAIVNMDWRYVKAVDLYVLLSSFVPPNGQIKSVAVYPSEFGLQRMKEEEVSGPVGLFDDENAKSNGESSDDDIDNEKLRAYEKSRMRYYYAVVECDSSTTADSIYKECDGLEFIQSSNALDLRFIPDSMEFKHLPQDVATEAPANYECKDFYTRALQHSKVNLSWDEDEPLRAKTLNRKFNDEQLAELELKEFLTSDESESDDGEDNNETEDWPNKNVRKQEKYRALLQFSDGSDEDGEDDGQDMEVTFSTGLEDISKRIMEKKDKNSETVWEAYLRKRREKKKARKNKSKYSSDDDNSTDADQDGAEDEDDFFIEEPAVKKMKEAQRNRDREHMNLVMDGVAKASKEELELLLADDKGTDTGLRGYNVKFKKGKGKRGKDAVDEGKIPSSAYDDPRFAALFKPDYVIDPTDPQFKRSAAYARQLAQKKQKGHLDLSAETQHVKPPKGMQLSSDDSGMMNQGKEERLDALQLKEEKYELSSLVKSIKMKSKQVQLPSGAKIKKDGKLRFKGMEKKRH